MPIFHLIILALIQGITEFLPVSSSGHLVVFHNLVENGIPQAERWGTDLMLDVAVHVGTLASVLLYFRRDLITMLIGAKDIVMGKANSEGAKLNIYLVISSIPVIVAGFYLSMIEPQWLRSVQVIAWTSIIFGFVLWLADSKSPAQKTIKELTLKDAILVGLAQALALIPGTSRSGITMTMARMRGFNRTESAHYSLLLAIIAISGAGVLNGFKLYQTGDAALGIDSAIAACMSFIAGYIAISFMMKWLMRATFKIFAIYRIILGLVLLGGIYGGLWV